MNGAHRQGRGPVRPRRIIAAVAVLACLAVALWFTLGRDQNPHTAATGNSGPRPSASAAANSGAASSAPGRGSSAASTASSGPCDSPAACGFPSSTDTGPRTQSLVAHSGNIEIRKNGEVVNGWNLDGALDVMRTT